MWLQDEYIYRRNLSMVSPTTVPAGHPATVKLAKSLFTQGKTRPDYEDIEVVYVTDDATPVLQVVDRIVEDNALTIDVTFNLQEGMITGEEVNERYYVYYGNLNLTNQIARPSQLIESWPVTIAHDDGIITYTRPGEHWEDGRSNTPRARANLVFYGTQVRLVSEVGFYQALLEAQVDNSDWETVDLFSTTPEVKTVYEKFDLDPETKHELTLRVVGDSNLNSLGDSVNIVSVDYRKPVIITDLGEQVNDLVWSSSVGGA